MKTLRSLRLIAAAAALLLMSGFAHAQQQTGSLLFDVTGADGKPVAGAKIVISSEKVPGQERLTDEFGKARFLLLPPGAFKAEVSAEGFGTFKDDAIDVPLGQRINVNVKLQPVLEESMDVTAPTEATIADVDVTQTKTGTVMNAEQLKEVQIGSGARSYLSALAKTPGVAGTGNASVHGATAGENVYTIDGVNTTDPVTGTFGLNTNFDIIEQLEVSTGGFQAEYGGATGGIINQITKSGTNEFEGSLDIRYYDEGFVTNTPHFPGGLPSSFQKMSATLTGPVKKDKLWFALSYEDNQTETTPSEAKSSRAFTGHANLAKLTWEPASGHRIALQYTEDPAEIDNANAGKFVDPTANRFQSQGANFTKLNYSGQITDNWALTAQFGRYRSELDSYPQVDSGMPGATERSTGYAFNNYTNAQYSKRTNDQFGFQLQRSWSSAKSDHDLKFGFDDQQTGLDYNTLTPGGETWQTTCDMDRNGVLDAVCDLDGDNRLNVTTDNVTWLDADNNGDGIPDNVRRRIVSIDAGPTENPGHNQSAYVQDTWRRGKYTWDFGLRWDRATAKRDDKTTVVDVELFQPRLGMAMDIKGDGKQKFSWSLSRRMHPGILTIPNAVNTRAGYTDYYYNERLLNTDFDGDGVIEDAFSFYARFGGPSGSNVDPDLKPTYLDEFIAGYERKLRTSMRFASRLVLNETNDIIEDTEYPVGSGQYEIRNLPGLRREYQGIEFEYGWLHKRGSLTAIATLSKSKGNVEYTQGLGADFDLYPDHFVNRYGNLSTDARLRLRVFGAVNLPKNWQIGYDLNYRSGLPYNRTRALNTYDVEFLERRGSRRMPSFYTLDSEVRKMFNFGKNDRLQVTLLGSINNIMNANAVTGVVQDDPVTNSQFGSPTAWQAPRQFELGMRLEF